MRQLTCTKWVHVVELKHSAPERKSLKENFLKTSGPINSNDAFILFTCCPSVSPGSFRDVLTLLSSRAEQTWAVEFSLETGIWGVKSPKIRGGDLEFSGAPKIGP